MEYLPLSVPSTMIEIEADEREKERLAIKRKKKLDCILKRALWTNKNNSGKKTLSLLRLLINF